MVHIDTERATGGVKFDILQMFTFLIASIGYFLCEM